MEMYVWLPALAGLIIQILNLTEAAKLTPDRRPNFKDPIYWIPFIVGPFLGGFAGFFSFHDDPNSFTAYLGVQVGVAAPLILKGLANSIPTPPPTK